MRKGFTLVELLVVIGIIGILSGVLLVAFSSSGEAARAAKCLTNMKSLASACQAYGGEKGCYPFAGSIEVVGVDESKGVRNVKMAYDERPGWISWYSNGAYRHGSTTHISSSSWFLSCYSTDDEAALYCLTNGTLWKYVSANRDIYVCPSHREKFKQHPPKWSYAMSSYFGWDNSKGSKAKDIGFGGIQFGKLTRADRRLIFAEIPYTGKDVPAIITEAPGTECDCTLQYKANEGDETIGFNHLAGKRNRFAHIAYADGHCEKLKWPLHGLQVDNIKDLTKWLCTAVDCALGKDGYEKLEGN